MLNVLSIFIPPNQRVVSIEQTKELTLPESYFQWISLLVREPTSEGAGGISMLDLMVNSLRMRPDRIIVGEIRRAEELHAKLTLEGIPSTIEARVEVGPFKTRQEAEAARAKLKALGIDAVLLPPKGGKR